MESKTPADAENHNRSRLRSGIALLGMALLGVAGVGAYLLIAGVPKTGGEGDVPVVFATAWFTPHREPRKLPEIRFQDTGGHQLTFANFKGKVVLLNVWATWCSPCRNEMPTLDRLERELGGPHFEVVALSVDRGGPVAVRAFFDEIDVRWLRLYIDPSGDAMAALAIVGLPTTLLIDATGREVWRVVGPADWDGRDVVAALRKAITSSAKS